MLEGRLPDFLLIGAAKSGTTSLYKYLSQHPEIFMPTFKEPKFFMNEGRIIHKDDPVNKKTITSLDEYSKLFTGVGNDKIVGEASGYLASSAAAKRIKHYIPNVKLIAILRDPVERAFSHHSFSVQKGFEVEPDFEKAVSLEKKNVNVSDLYVRSYLRQGQYYKNLSPYYDLFPEENIRVFLYEDLKEKPQELVKDIYEFLGVNAQFSPNFSVKQNKSGVPRNRIIHRFYQNKFFLRRFLKRIVPESIKQRVFRTIETKNLKQVSMEPDLRPMLQEYFKDDIVRLETLIKRDLSKWLK